MKKLLTLTCLITSYFAVSQTDKSIDNLEKETSLLYNKTESDSTKLDIDLKIEDNNTLFYKVDNTLYNRNDYVILRWAEAIKQTQKFSQKEASKLWQELHLRKMTRSEKKAFVKGFNSVSETEITSTK